MVLASSKQVHQTLAQTRNYSRSSHLAQGRRTLGESLREGFDSSLLLHRDQGKDGAHVFPIETSTLICKPSLWLHSGREVTCLLLHTSKRILGSGSWLDRGIFPQTLLRTGGGCDFRDILAKVQCFPLAHSRHLAIHCEGFPTHPCESPLFGVQSSALRLMVSHLVKRLLSSSDTALLNNAPVTNKLFWISKHLFTFALLSD